MSFDPVTKALVMSELRHNGQVGYTETEKVYLLNETVIPKGQSPIEGDKGIPLVEGETYTVVFDGVEYERVCTVLVASILGLGNGYLAGVSVANNGDIFGITSNGDLGVKDKTVDHTISVYQKKETLHPIDPKFLPDDNIDFAPYELGIPAFVLSGGGTKEIQDAEKAQQLFGEIREKKPKYALITLGRDVYRCAIAVSAGDALGFFLIATQMGTMITAKIFIAPIYTEGGYHGITITAEVS